MTSLQEVKYRLFSFVNGGRLSIRGGRNSVQRKLVKLVRSRISVDGDGCQVSIGSRTNIWDSRIELRGRNLRLEIGKGVRIRSAHIVVEDEGCWLRLGDGTSMTGARFIIAGQESGVDVGSDCMFAMSSCIRNTDSHSILSGEGNERCNLEQNVKIGDHVWIGEDVHVLKGSAIGSNTIVGAKSLVASRLDGDSIYVGNPARKIRCNISWDRRRL